MSRLSWSLFALILILVALAGAWMEFGSRETSTERAVRGSDASSATRSAESEEDSPAEILGTAVRRSGTPVAGCTVRLEYVDEAETSFPPSNTSSEDGSFHLRGVRPGAVKLWLWKYRYGASEPLVLDLAPGESREGVVLSFE